MGYPLTGTEIAVEYLDRNRPVEFTDSHGDHIVHFATLDFDYDMAFLLRVDYDDSSCSWLAVRKKFGHELGSAENLLVEWLIDYDSPAFNKKGSTEFFLQEPWEVLPRFVEWSRQVMNGCI